MANLNPAKFVREVRQEIDKITWPTRKEAGISTMMVLVLASLAATFFILVDTLLSALVRTLIGI